MGWKKINDSILTDIADAIRDKNGDTDAYKPQEMATAISAIQTGGGAVSVAPKDINFYDDYDGVIVEAWTLDELQSKTVLPDNPTHDGMISQGWNWTLEQLKSTNRAMNVGQMYDTADGFTRLHIRLVDPVDLMGYIRFSGTVANGTTIDWGDGTTTQSNTTSINTYSHAYALTGDYTITLRTTNGTISFWGANNSSNAVGMYSTYNKTNANKLIRAEIGSKTSIETYAFVDCGSLSSITIPSSVTSIEPSVFQYCYSLSSITIPSGVTSIGAEAFQRCGGIKEFHFQRTTPPTIYTDTFSNTATNSIFYVPIGSLSAYQSATNWSTYASRMQEESE